ncbi:MAG TPA: hypothetical protein VG939_20205 [Caulobacteraceae bacterium]|nr:hypothetical protein [Caulobacteraceae bacterium]
MTASGTDSNRMSRFWGALLMALGGLVAGLCGLCTLGFSALFLSEPCHGPDCAAKYSGLILPLVLGLPPTAVGVVVFLVGLGLVRRANRGAGKAVDKAFE